MNQIQNLGTNKIHFNLEVEVDKLVSEAENEKISMIVERVAETMKKEYGSAVAEFESKLTEAYDLIDKLSKRIEKLETAVNSGQAQQSSSQEYKTVSSFPTSGKITTLSEEQMKKILSYPNEYKKRGNWIYYTSPFLSKDQYKYIYRVRSNGTENEQILPMKISAYFSWDISWDIENQYIEFLDEHEEYRRMPIPPEKSQTPESSKNKTTTLSEEQIQEILSYSDKYKKKEDWIYYTYPLNERYAYLYRVRSNGTDNEKILPMKISARGYEWHIKADCIEFEDENFNKRRMPIPPEPPKTTHTSKNAKPALSKQEIKYILSYSSCYRREGDWIYSVDPDAGRYSYLYRCRSDGSENKKLLDFKIDKNYGWSVKNGQIKVKDQEGKVRKFTITN